MALSINGTTGISGVDGSASAPALQGTDSNTGINFASDTVNINTGGVTRATVDSTGRLLLGTTDVGSSGVDDLIVNVPSGNGGMTIRNGVNNNGNIFFSDGTSGAAENAGYLQYQHAQDTLVIGTSGSERMRIDTDGVLSLNTTYAGSSTNGSPIMVIHPRISQTSKSMGIKFQARADVYDVTHIQFEHAVNQQVMGNITSANAGATSYNTSSDYRLKENVVNLTNGITRLKTLKPKRFNFIIDETNTLVDGFLAHEVTAVPEAITGTKDEVDSDNNPVYQGIDQSKLVPLLTAALQEAVAKIEVLETKVAALEAG